MDKEFDKICEKLLDTGKGNKLVNYKESINKSIEIKLPDYETIFNTLFNGKSINFFDVDSVKKKVVDGVEESKTDYLERITEKVNNGEMLAIKDGATLKKFFSGLKKTAQTSLLENGINILYLAFGFIEWVDSEHTGLKFFSPLILMPVSIDGETQRFSLKPYDDEIETNPTIIYKLQSEYNITLPKFQETGYEEESLANYFDRVEKIVTQRNWKLNRNVVLGTFSFLKVNMYKDLKEHEPIVLENPLIQKLLNRTVEEEQKQIEENQGDKGLELTLHNVVDADSSQMEAIYAGKKGESFVLQGPPGTGKSQTITNLIAEFLYDGKKVLFVSEKLAALNVVANNLRKAGLGDYQLELHSNKTNKKEVLDELYRVLTSTKKQLAGDTSEVIDNIKGAKKHLDDYIKALHTKAKVIEKTPFEILCEISKLSDVNTFEYPFSHIEGKSLNYLNTTYNILQSISMQEDLVGGDYRQSCWYGLNAKQVDYAYRAKIRKDLEKVSLSLQDLVNALDSLQKDTGVLLVSLSQVYDCRDCLDAITKLKIYDEKLFQTKTLKNIIEVIGNYNQYVEELKDDSAIVNRLLRKEFFELDINGLYQKFAVNYASPFRVFKGAYKRDMALIKNYYKDYYTKLSYREICGVLHSACRLTELEREISNCKDKIAKFFDEDFDNINIDFVDLQNQLMRIETGVDLVGVNMTELTPDEFEDKQKCIKVFLDKITSIKTIKTLCDRLQEEFDRNIVNFDNMYIKSIFSKLFGCYNQMESMEGYIRVKEDLKELENFHLKEFLDVAMEMGYSMKKVPAIYKKLFYIQWLDYIFASSPVLKEFTLPSHENALDTFRKNDKLKFELSKAEIVAKQTARIPNIDTMASGSQLAELVREHNKKSRQKPVRILLQEVGAVIQKIKPCFLMSPLSVSTYLDNDTCKFDVVIFDEASQIFPWDSLGAIYRGKQVIVVGDSQQMPPSNFFTAGMVEDSHLDDYQEDDSTDFESILDLSASTFPSHRLNWHYRSKTEDLIAFSNANYYDNNLVTFPTAKKDGRDMGISFTHVPNGVFDRKSKTNEIEANKVVDLIFKHFDTHPERSLGVVAFSISQQEMIDDILQKRRAKNNKYEHFFDNNLAEPFFIKNLETVQGDERDTIIFSVAYARDNEGKFYHNFGPLNKRGGERRLNVAVTRAKYSVQLVSSIRSFDIDLSRTLSVGARLLKEYLACAENGVDMYIKDRFVSIESMGYMQEIFEMLESKGYRVDKNVGCSEYTIDLGVKHPKKDDYVLGIECDGVMYHSLVSTRDRDRLRGEVLSNFGWKLIRIWSVDWFKNRSAVTKKILSTIDNAIADYDSDKKINSGSQSVIDDSNSFLEDKEVVNKDIRSLFPQYVFHTKKDFSGYPSWENVVLSIVRIEQPVHPELLLKYLASIKGYKSISNAFRLEFEYNVNLLVKRGLIYLLDGCYCEDKNLVVYMRLPSENDPARDVDLIPNIEIESGMLTIIKHNVSITKDGLYSTIIDLLKYKRITEKIRNKLDECTRHLIKLNRIKVIDNDYSLK